ncbi:MAG: M48 family metallopeptidase [Euryarchaeota archaeon]|nr:M48 family metallopeptidase [Euryarchaeota archaeon]
MDKKIKIHDLEVKYRVVQRKVKYARLEIKKGDLLVVLPEGYHDHEKIMKKHQSWIYNKVSSIRNTIESSKYKKLKLERSDGELKDLVNSLVEKFSSELGVKVNNVFFRKMKTRWGSCSSRKNLTINTLLKYLPDNLIHYVIFHEMVHLIEWNHGQKFWNIISKKFSDYQKIRETLSIYWFTVQDYIENGDYHN